MVGGYIGIKSPIFVKIARVIRGNFEKVVAEGKCFDSGGEEILRTSNQIKPLASQKVLSPNVGDIPQCR